MEAKAEDAKVKEGKAGGKSFVIASEMGAAGSVRSQRALIAQIAAGQKAQIAREGQRPRATLPGVGVAPPIAIPPIDGMATPS
jgi:hypothetical protein